MIFLEYVLVMAAVFTAALAVVLRFYRIFRSNSCASKSCGCAVKPKAEVEGMTPKKDRVTSYRGRPVYDS